MLKPLGDRIVVKALEAESQSSGGIILPDTAKEKPQQGEVLAVGPGKTLDNGKISAVDVQGGTIRSSTPSTAAPRSKSAARMSSSCAPTMCWAF